MGSRRFWAALVTVVAGALLLPACDSPEPPPVTAWEMPGIWCSAQRDRLNVDSSGEFELTNLSREYFSVLQNDEEEYTKEFALKRDYGGQIPTAGHGGGWTFDETSTSPRLYLEFKALGSFLEQQPSELIVRRDEQGAIGLYGYESDPDLGYTVKFVKCS